MSKNKNPYESQETMDIPEYLLNKAVVEEKKEIVNEEVEEMSERETRRTVRLNDKTVMLAGILLAALLLISLISIIFAVNRGNALKAKELEYQELAKAYNDKDAEYQAKINDMQAQIDALIAGGSGQDVPVDDNKQTKFIVIAKEVNVRSEPNSDGDNIVGKLQEGKVFTVFGDLVKDNSGRSWGKIGDKQWVCIYIDNGADGYAEEYAG